MKYIIYLIYINILKKRRIIIKFYQVSEKQIYLIYIYTFFSIFIINKAKNKL